MNWLLIDRVVSGCQAVTSKPTLPPRAQLGVTALLFLILVGGLGVLLLITLIRWSVRRMGTSGSERSRGSDVPPSAWSVAGSRASPAIADESDGADGSGDSY